MNVDPGSSGEVVIPGEVSDGTNTYTVTEINSAFYNKTTVTSVKMPNTITVLKDRSFQGCSALKSVEMSQSLTTMEMFVFYECTSLETISLPASLQSMERGCFGRCSSLKTVYMNSSTPPRNGGSFSFVPFLDLETWPTIYVPSEYYDAYASSIWNEEGTVKPIIEVGDEFVDNGFKFTVTSVDPKTVKVAKAESLSGELVIPGSVNICGETYTVTEIADYGFQRAGITSVTLPNSVKTISERAFFNCKYLQTVIIPNNSVTVLGSGAFEDCVKLESVSLGNSLTSLPDNAFMGCNKLVSINLPETLTSIGSYAFYGAAITSIEVPDAVTTIGEGAFLSCSKLTSITLPSSLEVISWSMLSNCSSLTTVDIPASVTTIGDYAFRECGLSKIQLSGTVPPTLGTGTFDYCPSGIRIFVPDGYVDTYIATDWDNVGIIVSPSVPYAKPRVGDGSQENPYQIGTAEELQWFGATVNSSAVLCGICGVLTADIDLAGIDWTPIGWSEYEGVNCKYSGIFDGAGHSISNLTIRCHDKAFIGLFGEASSQYGMGIIRNINLVDCAIYDDQDSVDAGAICGTTSGRIERCSVSGNLISTAMYSNIGGICANLEQGGNITDCISNVTITSTSYNNGGICGLACGYNTITGCYSVGTIDTENNSGAILSQAGVTVNVANCYYLNGTDSKAEQKTAEQFASGEVCYVLDGGRGVWYQTFGTDDYPVLDNTHAKVIFEDEAYLNPTTSDSYTHTDTEEYASPATVHARELTYVRTFGNNIWEPLYVPFEISLDEISEEADVAELAGVHMYDNGKTVIEFLTVTDGKLHAHTPYMIKAKAQGDTEIALSDKLVLRAPSECTRYISCSTPRWEYRLYGTYKNYSYYDIGNIGYDLGAYPYIWTADQTFVHPTYPQGAASGRFLLVKVQKSGGYWGAPARAASDDKIHIMVDGVELGDNTTTGIDDITIDNAAVDASFYDMQGRRVDNPAPGIYIRGGKKVIVR